MKCSSCGAQIHGVGQYCPYCGNELEQRTQDQKDWQHGQANAYQPEQPYQQQIHIHNHYQVPPDRVVEHVYYQRQRSQRSRLVMFLLFLFLGYLGVHHFYTGRIGKGLLYLFTGGLCGIGLFIDFFVILLGTPRDREGLPILW